MWVLEGQFDGDEIGDAKKQKLLKPGTSYTVGRKDRALTIPSRKVSHDHCQFIVGDYTSHDFTDASVRPKLTLSHQKPKGLKISRGDKDIMSMPDHPQELEVGDSITMVGGIAIKVIWEEVRCYTQKASVSDDACASLGISLVHVPDAHVTHHLTSNYVATPLIAASLISAATLVKPEWLYEIVRLGRLESDDDPASGTSLEDTFALPAVNKFRPAFSPSLPQSQKAFKVWEPNEERLHLFQEYRFICAGEKSRLIDSDLRELITRGGGTIETFDAATGAARLRKALSRGAAKDGKKLVLVGDLKAIDIAVGKSARENLVKEANEFGLQFIPPNNIVQAVLDVDTTSLDKPSQKDAGDDESLPDFIPNTHQDEPSILPESEQPQRPKTLKRRVESRQASEEPQSINAEVVEAPRPRRALTRRVNSGVVTGVDDSLVLPSVVPDVASSSSKPPPDLLTAPTPARSSTLKRRVVGVSSQDTGTMETGYAETYEEPPLKKFKALFDASDPDRAGAEFLAESPMNFESDPFGGSLSQSQSQSGTRSTGSRTLLRKTTSVGLGALREEEEEATQSTFERHGTKRTLELVDEDEEIVEVDQNVAAGSGSELPAAKKRAVENVNAVQKVASRILGAKKSLPMANSAEDGTPVSRLDSDAEFLKAIATKKKGKDDLFDKEFNNLRISKPAQEAEEKEAEWGVLADFGDDSGLRGNFMVILELDIYNKKSREQRVGQSVDSSDGKPNFKKFKQKVVPGTRRAKVELVAVQPQDYGVGPKYWKSKNSQSQNNQRPTQSKTNSMGQITNGKSQEDNLDDFDEAPQLQARKVKSRSRSASVVAAKRASSRAKSAPKPTLFLDSDEDIKEEDEVDAINSAAEGDYDETSTLRSTRSSAAQRKPPPKPKSKKKAIVVNDDSDDDAVFQGF